MEYSEALKEKDLILQQIEELGKKMNKVQHIIDGFKDTVNNLNKYINKFIVLKENHHFMYVSEVKLKDNICIFKGIMLTKEDSYQILDYVLKEYHFPIKDIDKIHEINEFDFTKEILKGTVKFTDAIKKLRLND